MGVVFGLAGSSVWAFRAKHPRPFSLNPEPRCRCGVELGDMGADPIDP